MMAAHCNVVVRVFDAGIVRGSNHNILVQHRLSSNRQLRRRLRRKRIKSRLLEFRMCLSQTRVLFSRSDSNQRIADREIFLLVDRPGAFEFKLSILEALSRLFLNPFCCIDCVVWSERHGGDEDDGYEHEG